METAARTLLRSSAPCPFPKLPTFVDSSPPHSSSTFRCNTNTQRQPQVVLHLASLSFHFQSLPSPCTRHPLNSPQHLITSQTLKFILAAVVPAGGGGGRWGPPAMYKEAGGEWGQRQAVNPNCPNAANPFHRCAEYCPVPVPSAAAKPPPPPPGRAAQNGSAHSDGELLPRPRRRDRDGGSGGLPLYVFLREGSDGDGKKVDPRCPNAANPFHVCTDHCLAKMAEPTRLPEGGNSPISLFSASSSEDGSVKSGASKKADPRCPNATNPFHECAEYCTAKMREVEQQKGTDKKSPPKEGGKDITAMQNWKVDPRCPNASNPFHICAQYCFDHLNEPVQKNASKPDSRKGKAVLKAEQTGEINPNCVNASNPYHKCGEYCKRKGDR